MYFYSFTAYEEVRAQIQEEKEDEDEDSDPFEAIIVAETPEATRDTANESIRSMYSANRSATTSDLKNDDFMVIDLVGENSNQGAVESTPVKKLVLSSFFLFENYGQFNLHDYFLFSEKSY